MLMQKKPEDPDLVARAQALADDLEAAGHDIAAALAEQIAILLAPAQGRPRANVIAIDRSQIS